MTEEKKLNEIFTLSALVEESTKKLENIQYSGDLTPLMKAAHEGNNDEVNKLIKDKYELLKTITIDGEKKNTADVAFEAGHKQLGDEIQTAIDVEKKGRKKIVETKRRIPRFVEKN